MNMVCQQGLHDGSQDRNAAADAGFKHEVDTVLFCQGTQLGTVNRHHFLVGCDCALSGTDGLFYKSIGRFHTAHDLCNDADLRISQDHLEVVHNTLLDRVARKISEVEYIFYVNLFACLALYHICV